MFDWTDLPFSKVLSTACCFNELGTGLSENSSDELMLPNYHVTDVK